MAIYNTDIFCQAQLVAKTIFVKFL